MHLITLLQNTYRNEIIERKNKFHNNRWRFKRLLNNQETRLDYQ